MERFDCTYQFSFKKRNGRSMLAMLALRRRTRRQRRRRRREREREGQYICPATRG
jgi:hypothetical protein